MRSRSATGFRNCPLNSWWASEEFAPNTEDGTTPSQPASRSPAKDKMLWVFIEVKLTPVLLHAWQFSKKLLHVYTQCEASKGVSSLTSAGAMKIQ